jgi:tricarballylate dehydrogenase
LGITLHVRGLKIDTGGHVLDIDDNPIRGLYAAGELIGGLWYFNYPGSAGLMAGAVFGRLAGRAAGEFATKL